MPELDREPAAPLQDPFAPRGAAAGDRAPRGGEIEGAARPSSARAPRRGVGGRGWLALGVVLGALAAAGAGLVIGVRAWLTPPPASTSVVTVRSTPDVLIAVRDLARLETAEVHVEKVIDLTDTQSHLFGLVEGTDAILLVAVGDATLGIDLSKLGPADVSMDAESKTAHLRLPAPEVLHAGLDEKGTYVYTRSTSLLARRNEQLEGQARREAVAAIEKAAGAPDMKARAKAQAERQLRALVGQLGAERVEITWRE